MSHVTHGRWWVRQRARWCTRLSGGADELGDVLETLILVEVIDWVVAQELARHEQSGLCVRRAVTRVGG